MITVRRAAERGRADQGWLRSFHTFSFADYYDPEQMGFRALRVINEDRVEPGHGFPTHSHRDMEIVTWVLDGVLEHRDSLGNGSIIGPLEMQRMTAGTGVRHSEYNTSKNDLLHLLQIWLLPARRSLTPSYEQRTFPERELRERLRLVGSADGRDGSVTIHQDVSLYATRLEPRERLAHEIQPRRHAWLQVARGSLTLNGIALYAGDGAAASDESSLAITATSPAEALLFDLA